MKPTPTPPAAAPACECESGLAYVACCGRYLDHGERPATAEALMRSRYSAYARGNTDYLRATWHASTRPADLALETDTATRPKWIGLAVRDHANQDEDHATVEFVARYRIGGRAHRLHERSRFVRQEGRWFYVDGDMLE